MNLPIRRAGAVLALAATTLLSLAQPAAAETATYDGCIIAVEPKFLTVRTSGNEVLRLDLSEFKNEGSDRLALDECYRINARQVGDRLILETLNVETPLREEEDKEERDRRKQPTE